MLRDDSFQECGPETGALPAGCVLTNGCESIAETLRVIAHPHRLRILYRLIQQEQAVVWLAKDAGIAPHTASSHLRLMQRQGLVKGIRRGKFVHYAIANQQVLGLMRSIEPWLTQ